LALKGLLLDFGGVLTTSVTESFASFAVAEGLDPADLERAMRAIAKETTSPFLLVETGRIDVAEFERGLAAALSPYLGRAIEPERLKERLFAAVGPDEAMIAAVEVARAAGVRTALVSNSWGNTDGPGGYPKEQFGELFDAVVISAEVGIRKPDPAIFLMSLERIGCAPGDCAFVDDFPVNVEGAEAVGIHGVLHRSATETIAELERFFGVRLWT
jgi:putative hydrolase of the HAD superfamily